MSWEVTISRRAAKQLAKLPKNIEKSLIALIREIEAKGPNRGNWPNFSKLDAQRYHCHLKKGHPTYVAIWRVEQSTIRLVEVIYVGTHEKAPY